MTVEANGIAIRYQLEGPADAPVVTPSHSLAANLHLWEAQAGALAYRYRVLRYDLRGRGGSAVPAGPYTLEQMADDLHGLRALGIARTHFVGLSERIAGSELIVIPKAAHCSCVENPDEFNRAHLEFLRRVG